MKTRIIDTVFDILRTEANAGRWKMPFEIAGGVTEVHGSTSESTVTARIRDLRKPEYGGHTVLRRKREGSSGHEYLLVPNPKADGVHPPVFPLGFPVAEPGMAPRDRLLFLANHIENHVADEQFEMGDWGDKDIGPKCGTAGCLLGHATVVFPELSFVNGEITLETEDGDHLEAEEAGAELLGVSLYDANLLFLNGFLMSRGEKAEQLRALANQ